MYKQVDALLGENRLLADREQLQLEQLATQQEQIVLLRQQNTALAKELKKALEEFR